MAKAASLMREAGTNGAKVIGFPEGFIPAHPLWYHFALDAQGANIHVAAWPSHFGVGTDMQDLIMLSTRSLAYQMKAFVINAVGEVSEVMRRELPASDEHRAFLAAQGGGACIIGPRGQVLAGPMPPGEGILYADVSLDDLVVAKSIQDFGGHYNRFDIFDVRVMPGAYSSIRHDAAGKGEPARIAGTTSARFPPSATDSIGCLGRQLPTAAGAGGQTSRITAASDPDDPSPDR